MYFQKRGARYTFVYYSPELKKNTKLKVSEFPPIHSDQEAQEFVNQWNKRHPNLKSAVQEKLKWLDKFPEFEDLLKIFEKAREEEAPYSWKTYAYYLRYHCLFFFLCLREEPIMNNWYLHFEDFRVHLQEAPSLKRMNQGRDTLAYSTMNAVIKALNSFLTIMHRRQKIDYPWKCRLFDKRKLRRKGAESVIDPAEQKRIYENLQSINGLSAAFFYVSLHTGLRRNEMAGLSLDDFYKGLPDSKPIQVALKPHSFTVHGYIALESQPALKDELRDESGRVPRKPLKQKKEISGENSRTIPIFNSECFNILAKLWNAQLHRRKCLPRSRLGPKDFLLFDGLSLNAYSNHLRKAQGPGRASFTPHDTRHTYSTWLAEETGGDYRINKLILGHSSESETNRYAHMSERIHQQIKSKLQLQRPMEFTSVEKRGEVVELRPFVRA